ncbi:hypothetical protein VNI00_019424 [Paramarasmius palmivorus]|uniref:Uncharacterized protein n=1 Tax=Paramarasmius palmivorus TaxID=297713 RepID=A0AAW0AMC7_9AGAR
MSSVTTGTFRTQFIFYIVIAVVVVVLAGFAIRWYYIKGKRQRANALSRPLRNVRPSLWERLKLSRGKKPKDEEDMDEMDETTSTGTITAYPPGYGASSIPPESIPPAKLGHNPNVETTNAPRALPSGSKL